MLARAQDTPVAAWIPPEVGMLMTTRRWPVHDAIHGNQPFPDFHVKGIHQGACIGRESLAAVFVQGLTWGAGFRDVFPQPPARAKRVVFPSHFPRLFSHHVFMRKLLQRLNDADCGCVHFHSIFQGTFGLRGSIFYSYIILLLLMGVVSQLKVLWVCLAYSDMPLRNPSRRPCDL